MNDLYTYPINDYRNYLQHHGTKGQRWGVRNAEWYPISEWKASKANKEAEKKENKASRAEGKYEKARHIREKYVDSMARKATKRREQYEKAVSENASDSKLKKRLNKAERANEEYETAKKLSDKYLSRKEKKASDSRNQANEARQYANEQRERLLKKALQDPNLLRKHVNEIPAKDVEEALNRFNRERRVEQAARDKNTVYKKDFEQLVIGPGKMIVGAYGTYRGVNELYKVLKSFKK